MCTYLHQTKAHWRESFIFPHFLFIFSRQSRRFLSFANCVPLVDSAVILQSGTRRHHHHRTFFQNLGFAVSAFIFLSEIRVCGSALICLIRDLWIGFYSFLARTCDCLRLGFSLSLSLSPSLFASRQKTTAGEAQNRRSSLSKNDLPRFFWTPNRVSTTCGGNLRTSVINGNQYPKFDFMGFLHYVWIYWLIHDLLLLGFMGFFFFLSFMFFSFTLFVDLIYSYFINQFRVNKLIWFPYSFLSFNKNFGLFSIFACQLFDLRPSLIDIQKQWYC